MDMVGGDPFKNKAIFHLTATPWSLPSFVTDVGASLLDTIRAARPVSTQEGNTSPDAGIVRNASR